MLTDQFVKLAASEDDESILRKYRVPLSLVAGGLLGAAIGAKYSPQLKKKLGSILRFGKKKARKAKSKTKTKDKTISTSTSTATRSTPYDDLILLWAD